MRDKAKQAANQRAYAKRRMANGQCVACSAPPPLKTKRLCAACHEKANAYQVMRREINRDNGFTARGEEFKRRATT